MPRDVRYWQVRSRALAAVAVGPPCDRTTSGGHSPSGGTASGLPGREKRRGAIAPPAVGNVIDSAIETYAGSTEIDVACRRTPHVASVDGSIDTTVGATVGVPTFATVPPGPARTLAVL